MNTNGPVLSGRPTEIGNCSNCPGMIEPPVHTIFDTASDTVPSSVLIGLVTGAVVTCAVHPGTGCTFAAAIGLSAGKATSTCTVLALSCSFGTWKTSTASDAFGALSGLTVTCAQAVPPISNDPTAPAANAASTLRMIPAPFR